MKETFSITSDKIVLKTLNGRKDFYLNTQLGCILEFMIEHFSETLTTHEITSSAAKKYNQRTSKNFAEMTGRGIRSLKEEGYIKRVAKGKYTFDGNYTNSKSAPFSKDLRDEIIKRDN